MGVSIHHLVAELDSGQVVLQETAVTRAELADMSYDQVFTHVHDLEHQLVAQWADQYC